MEAIRTKLDALLTSVVGAAAADVRPEEPHASRLIARTLAPAPSQPLLEPTAEPPVTSVKLLVRSSDIDTAAAWVEGHGGSVDVRPGPAPGDRGVTTLVCRVDPRALGGIEDAPWALRAEAPRILFPKMDAARGPATGLDAALAAVPGGPTGDGVLVAVIDSGWTGGIRTSATRTGRAASSGSSTPSAPRVPSPRPSTSTPRPTSTRPWRQTAGRRTIPSRSRTATRSGTARTAPPSPRGTDMAWRADASVGSLRRRR